MRRCYRPKIHVASRAGPPTRGAFFSGARDVYKRYAKGRRLYGWSVAGGFIGGLGCKPSQGEQSATAKVAEEDVGIRAIATLDALSLPAPSPEPVSSSGTAVILSAFSEFQSLVSQLRSASIFIIDHNRELNHGIRDFIWHECITVLCLV